MPLILAVVKVTAVSSRAWATSYVLGAAFLAAATYYFPFDVVIGNGEVIGPKHPSYELVLVLSLPIGAIGFLVESSSCQEARCGKSSRCSHFSIRFHLTPVWSTSENRSSVTP